MQNEPSQKIKRSLWLPLTIAGVGLVLVVLAAFVLIHKPQSAVPVATTGDGLQPNSGQAPQTYGSSPNCQATSSCPSTQSNGSGTPPVDGTITALDSSSISVRPSNGAAIQTFGITSASTIEQSNGSTEPYDASDLHVGEKVTIVATLNDSTKVESVALGTGSTNSVQE